MDIIRGLRDFYKSSYVYLGPFRSVHVLLRNNLVLLSYRGLQVTSTRVLNVYLAKSGSVPVHFGPFRWVSVRFGPFRSVPVRFGD